jgi:hypothetical protein
VNCGGQLDKSQSGCVIVPENVDEGYRHQARRKPKVKESFGPKNVIVCFVNFLCINRSMSIVNLQFI